VSSKAHRRKVRAQRRRKRVPRPAPPDFHAEVISTSFEGLIDVITRFAEADDPVADVDEALAELVEQLVGRFRGLDPAQVIEIARMLCLPWTFAGPDQAGAQNGPTRAELIALIAVSAARERGQEEEEATQAGVAPAVDEAVPLIDEVLALGQVRELAAADRSDRLAMITASVRASQIWIRNTSYPDMVSKTLIELFDEPSVSAALQSSLGFGIQDAISVLGACHSLQVDHLNSRMQEMGAAVFAAYTAAQEGSADEGTMTDARRALEESREPSAEAVTVSAAEIAAATNLATTVVDVVLNFFALDISEKTPLEVVRDFLSGSNPLRDRPVVTIGNGRVLLVHDAQNQIAIRDRLEQHLKTMSAVWEVYQKHRGALLETRVQDLFASLIPNARAWNGIEYYVPASELEAVGDPAGYTKRVEGDHLFVLDDVAVIVEDKAVAWSGQSRRLRRELTGIVQKAAEQASRLQERILQDGGIRVESEGWVDLSRIREIHTVAVSLDDLSGASTATAQLVQAGLLNVSHVPWTVSLHDLDLITQLVGRPAEFLLYLRRRRDPEATVIFTAADELDLFLYFFEAGLYVEPDPEKSRAAFAWMPAPTPSERRRRREQVPRYITSRTDALDQWYYAQLATARGENDDAAALPAKPHMVASPLETLIDELEARGDYAWLSIGATLLEGSTEFQQKLARIPQDLLDHPSADGRQRSTTIPFTSTAEGGWLLVWVTRPPGANSASFERDTKDYLRAKMHQLGLGRAVAFCFDESARELVAVYFDDHIGDLDPILEAKSRSLLPVERMTHFPPPGKRTRGGTKQRSTG
jgi:hypothetical protein